MRNGFCVPWIHNPDHFSERVRGAAVPPPEPHASPLPWSAWGAAAPPEATPPSLTWTAPEAAEDVGDELNTAGAAASGGAGGGSEEAGGGSEASGLQSRVEAAPVATPPPGDATLQRVAALEALVAALEARVAALEAR